jgi:hypothetical protein
MIEEWKRSCEQLAHSAVSTGLGILGFTSPEGHAGVSTLSRTVAEILTRSGIPILFVNMTKPIDQTAPPPNVPATPRGNAAAVATPPQFWQRSDDGVFPTITALANPRTQYQFNNVIWLRQSFERELAESRMLIVDIPPVLQGSNMLINPLASAAACHAVLLVCPRGQVTRPSLVQVMETLKSANVNVTGTVLNDYDYSTPGEEIGQRARKLLWPTPRFARWVDHTARSSLLLN